MQVVITEGLKAKARVLAEQKYHAIKGVPKTGMNKYVLNTIKRSGAEKQIGNFEQGTLAELVVDDLLAGHYGRDRVEYEIIIGRKDPGFDIVFDGKKKIEVKSTPPHGRMFLVHNVDDCVDAFIAVHLHEGYNTASLYGPITLEAVKNMKSDLMGLGPTRNCEVFDLPSFRPEHLEPFLNEQDLLKEKK